MCHRVLIEYKGKVNEKKQSTFEYDGYIIKIK